MKNISLWLLLAALFGYTGLSNAQTHRIVTFIELDGYERITFDAGQNWIEKNASHQINEIVFVELDGASRISNDRGMTWTKRSEESGPQSETLGAFPIAISNPVADGALTLQFTETGYDGEYNLSLYDLHGRLVHQQQAVYLQQTPVRLQLESVHPGIYFLHVSDGLSEVTRKLLVQ